MKPPKPEARGRPRTAHLTDRILLATLKLVAERGYGGSTVAAVAGEARTSKQAIYRRWNSKAVLVAAAVEHALAGANPVAPPGPLPVALDQALGAVADLLTTTAFGGAVRALVGVVDAPELAQALSRVEGKRRILLAAILERARGEKAYPADRDVDTDIDLLLGALYFRFLVRRRPVDRDFVSAIVASWWQGVHRSPGA